MRKSIGVFGVLVLAGTAAAGTIFDDNNGTLKSGASTVGAYTTSGTTLETYEDTDEDGDFTDEEIDATWVLDLAGQYYRKQPLGQPYPHVGALRIEHWDTTEPTVCHWRLQIYNGTTWNTIGSGEVDQTDW